MARLVREDPTLAGTFLRLAFHDAAAGLSTDGVRAYFVAARGLSDAEAVALCGAHTLGRWTSLVGLSRACLRELTDDCLYAEGRRLPFVRDPDAFTNSYFRYLLAWDAQKIRKEDAHFIPTDVVLTLDPEFRKWVEVYANDQQLFFRNFSSAYTKLVAF